MHVDPAAVDHAISNLIDNAIKWNAAQCRGTRRRRQWRRCRSPITGPAFLMPDLPHIFERFYRAPAARGMPGAGLGLAIVGSIAQANNGTLDVQTGPSGSTFTLGFVARHR